MEIFIEILDGLILGDACLERRKKTHNARYHHECVHYTYMNYIKQVINQTDTFIVSDFYPKERPTLPNSTYTVCSYVHEILTEQEERWYTNRIKHIPEDIRLTPNVLKHWYIGDGWLSWNTSNKRYKEGWNPIHGICFATEGFSFEDTDILLDKMKALGFPCGRGKDNNMSLRGSLVKDFLSYIGTPTCDCYDYKWQIGDRGLYENLKNTCSCTRENQQPSL